MSIEDELRSAFETRAGTIDPPTVGYEQIRARHRRGRALQGVAAAVATLAVAGGVVVGVTQLTGGTAGERPAASSPATGSPPFTVRASHPVSAADRSLALTLAARGQGVELRITSDTTVYGWRTGATTALVMAANRRWGPQDVGWAVLTDGTRRPGDPYLTELPTYSILADHYPAWLPKTHPRDGVPGTVPTVFTGPAGSVLRVTGPAGADQTVPMPRGAAIVAFNVDPKGIRPTGDNYHYTVTDQGHVVAHGGLNMPAPPGR